MSFLKNRWIPICSLSVLIIASNVLVECRINPWLTWGAFIYPWTFLVTELVNRRFGPQEARRVVYVGFCVAFVLSLRIGNPRIALASMTAFLSSQLLDISIFNRFKTMQWWVAPLVASSVATVVDTFLFFALAFAGTDFPWVKIALGDLGVKAAVNLCLLVPFRMSLNQRSLA